MKFLWIIALPVLGGLAAAAPAQAPSPAPAAARSQVIGEVTAIDLKSGQITLKPDKGIAVAVLLGERAVLRRVPPGEKDLTKATRISPQDLGVGDRVIAIGQESDDHKKLEARSLIVMSRTDLVEKQRKEREDWQKRGAGGIVSAADPAAKSFVLKVGEKSVTVEASTATEMRRYSLESIKFADAKPGTFEDVKPGDHMTVLGNRSEDGGTVKAEKIVSGVFRQVAGTIISVDAGAGEVKIKDLASKKPLTVAVNADSVMKKLAPQAAAFLARRVQGGRQAPQGPGGPPRQGGPDINQILDRQPALALAELKQGDAVMVSGSPASDPGRLNAATLLAGVEPLLTSPNATRDIMAGWNPGGGEEGGASQ